MSSALLLVTTTWLAAVQPQIITTSHCSGGDCGGHVISHSDCGGCNDCDNGCGKPSFFDNVRGFFGGLFNRGGGCDDGCGCDNGCGHDNGCGRGFGGFGLFDRIRGLFNKGCDDCNNDCGCGGGHIDAHGGVIIHPAPGGKVITPPVMPKADPAEPIKPPKDDKGGADKKGGAGAPDKGKVGAAIPALSSTPSALPTPLRTAPY